MSSSPSFGVYGKNKIRFSAEQFSPEKSVKIIMTEQKEFKFELIDIKKKYQLLKENLTYKEKSCLNFVQPDFYQASFTISNFEEEKFSEEDDNVSNVKLAQIVLL